MGILDRFRQSQPDAWHPDWTAIPLTPAEVALYVEGLQETHRLVKQARPDIGGVGSAATRRANEMLCRAGIAAAVGNSTVPVLCIEVHDLDYAVNDFHKYAPSSDLGRRFENLVSRMHALAGAARVHGWMAKLTETTVWEKEPDGRQVPSRSEIEP